ncbi:MAG: phosphoenolpyruvate carboxykinase [archaeon]
MQGQDFAFYGRQAIIKSDGSIPTESAQLTYSSLFKRLVKDHLAILREKDSPLLAVIPDGLSDDQQDALVLKLLQELSMNTKEEVTTDNSSLAPFFEDIEMLHQFVEQLYNYWRNYERFFVHYSQSKGENKVPAKKTPYRTFQVTIESLNHLVRKVYRDIAKNITHHHLRIYRQMPAGAQVGLIVSEEEWNCPSTYDHLKKIPFIRRLLIEPPLIIDPPMNKRNGQFSQVKENPIADVDFTDGDWLCYPAKVGDLLIHLFFHNKFIGLGTACANLFDLAEEEDLKRKPDAIYAYGVPAEKLKRFGDLPTVFYEDDDNGIMVGAVPDGDEFGYFGYVKKMMLTLHNIIQMKRGRIPLHGAMVRISLKDGKSANIIIVGDSGAGKSESLEAFRVLADKHIRDMVIVFDDMGSLELTDDGKLKAYGTETGAFVRLDDLQPGFAFGNLDRSIIMSPQKINARAVLPVTTIEEVLRGNSVDYFLYANNYEEVDDDHPFFQEFSEPEEAMAVFKKGARIGKGTTTETGLVQTYFANIFGPAQYKELHDGLAPKFFKALFDSGVRVAELRTRLAIPGFENKGPETAAEALFDVIRNS